jgi:GNAT superfamily N-acetyltransferase
VIRELAENPNLHQPLVAGRRLHKDRAGRFAVYLAPGRTVHDATVQRVRVDDDGVEKLLADVRALLVAEDRAGAEWELGESCTPPGLVERLLELGLERDPHEPVATGMALIGEPDWEIPTGVEARPVRNARELVAARRVQKDAFGDPRPVDAGQIRQEQTREGIDGSTFVALIDGQIVAAAYASFTPWGLIMFGGATLGEARGRGAYRALVAARAEEAAARGTPALVVHAGSMSRPILERLGFTPISRIDRLLDVL